MGSGIGTALGTFGRWASTGAVGCARLVGGRYGCDQATAGALVIAAMLLMVPGSAALLSASAASQGLDASRLVVAALAILVPACLAIALEMGRTLARVENDVPPLSGPWYVQGTLGE